MPLTPVFTPYEFLNASTMNAAAGAVSGSLAQTTIGTEAPGLIHPEALVLTASGLAIAVSAPLPFQTLFGTGVMASASGVTTGQVSSSYVVSFSGSVPASGAPVTAYLLASYQQIQQGAYQVVGPPPGHPDYNPLFVPTTAYNSSLNSIALAASLTPADGSTTFELARCTLASGATGVGAISTVYQQRASSLPASQALQVSGAITLSPATHGGKTISFTGAGVATLWLAAAGNGLEVSFTSSTSGACSVVVSGADQIYGSSSSAAAIGVSGISIAQGSLVTLESLLGIWQTTSESPNSFGASSSSSIWGGVSTGTANAQVIAPTVPVLSLSPGAAVSWIASATNTSAMTITVSGIGVLPVLKDSPAGPIALTGTEVASGCIARGQYDGVSLQLYSTTQGTAALANASSATGTVAAVSGATVSGTLPLYADASGTVKAGPALSSAQTTAVMASGAGTMTVGNFLSVADVNGTAIDSGFNAAAVNSTANAALYLLGTLL